ncbi:helicase associated domain-containing protein [Streptomyces sp. NPDC020379]|uniref:helicase associated domain-containing protein n=1 Tax=Streptomyces sp. NPDC020379 TaxID=3365071 RepID=UPI00378C065E
MTHTIDVSALAADTSFVDHLEQLLHYLVDHDNRLPTDETELAWWLAEMWQLPKDDPRHQAVALIHCVPGARRAGYSFLKTWSTTLGRLGTIDYHQRAGLEIKPGSTAAKDTGVWRSQYHSGSLNVVLEVLLRRRDFDFDGPLPKSAKRTVDHQRGMRIIRKLIEQGVSVHELPESVDDFPVRSWWAKKRLEYNSPGMKERQRRELEGLGVDLRTDKEIAKEARAAAAVITQELKEEAKRARKAQRRAWQLASRRGVDDVGPVLDAIRAFTDQHGHTAIPVGAITEEGVEFGRIVDQWRRAYALGRLDGSLRRTLEGIVEWAWRRTPTSPRIARPAPVAIPEDTTQMRQTGLRQFLPSD